MLTIIARLLRWRHIIYGCSIINPAIIPNPVRKSTHHKCSQENNIKFSEMQYDAIVVKNESIPFSKQMHHITQLKT